MVGLGKVALNLSCGCRAEARAWHSLIARKECQVLVKLEKPRRPPVALADPSSLGRARWPDLSDQS